MGSGTESTAEEVRLMLAESYSGQGKTYKAYEVLKGSNSAQNRYKFALTCIKLKKMSEAERALLSRLGRRPDGTKQVPNGAAGLYLLAHC